MKHFQKTFRPLSALLTLGLVAGLAACNRDPLRGLSPDDSQVFITNHDANAVFSGYRTFSIVDSVAVLSNQAQPTTSASIRELVFIARLAQDLKNRGYTQVARSEKPDLGINVARINDSYSGVVANYGGYGGYGYGGFGYGYGYGSPYYPTSYSYYEVRDNYYYAEALDLKNPATGTNGQPQARVIWNAEIRGDNIFDESSANRIADAVFAQSTYFQASK